MMIMGEICTRACAFCNVSTGLPLALDLVSQRVWLMLLPSLAYVIL